LKMSADLLAAFITGDAEGSSSKPKVTVQAQDVAPGSLKGEYHPATGPIRFPKRQLEENHSPLLWQKDSQGTDILFDAETAEEIDEFGDFEDVDAGDLPNESTNPLGQNDVTSGTRSTNPAQNTPDLISLEPDLVSTIHPSTSKARNQQESKLSPSPKRALNESKVAWDDDWGGFKQTSLEDKPTARSGKLRVSGQSTHAYSGPTDEAEEEWEAFEDGQPQPPQSKEPRQTQPPVKSTTMEQRITTPASRESVERPTNVPPPSTLLQLLSSVFEAIHDLNNTGQESKQVLGLRVLVIFRVVSRIITGRTLRWKRDTVLAQSVRIGQAGNSGGMKLTSVNKGESAKEERDVEDLISQWSRYAHEFNSILAQAHMTGTRLRLTSALSLKVLKVTGSSKQCALCGLQRTERINGVDTDTEDLFGEFWVEHWGHKDCCEFWYLYKELLSQR
jgi:hypothetical protein